jgi:F0F1-type ATP synthase membrane subunit c/vacuolar-type H+-ATPase subunit K
MMIDYLILFIISKFFIKGDLRRGYVTSVVLGILMIINLLIYIVIVELIKINFAPFQGFSDFPQVDTLKYVLLGVAIADFGLLYFIRRIIVKKLQEGDLRREEIVERLMPLSLIIYALCESIAIYGLILFLLAGNSLNFYIFLILCLVCLGIYFPRYGQWEKLAKLQ